MQEAKKNLGIVIRVARKKKAYYVRKSGGIDRRTDSYGS